MSTIVIDGVPRTELIVLAPGPSLDPAQPVIQTLPIPGGVDIDVTGALSDGWPEYGHARAVAALAATGRLWDVRTLYTQLWHGRQIALAWDDFPGKHLKGRARLHSWSWPAKRDIVLFTLELDAEPYWWADAPHTQPVAASPGGTPAQLVPTGYPVMPHTEVTGGPVQLDIGTTQVELTPGAYEHLEALMLRPAAAPLDITVSSEADATVTFTWREGWLA
ncbi:MAG: hypothetical protein LBH11_03390 [Propionibacteriaceae bacterium]|jgi:hypothetical protein|nr:hypothetical protein [Propionibacteriaceae bacterium]